MVLMAFTSRHDQALIDGDLPSASRRWLLVIAAVLAPITLGAVISVVLFATRPQPVVPRPAATVATSDIKARDGSVLVLRLETTGQVRIPLGTSVEVVLLPGYGEDIESMNTAILVATTNPPCHLKAICGFSGAHAFTFRAIGPGVANLRVIFGFMVCNKDADSRVRGCTITPYVFKPIDVYSQRQTS
jgi:hypothetical protein